MNIFLVAVLVIASVQAVSAFAFGAKTGRRLFASSRIRLVKDINSVEEFDESLKNAQGNVVVVNYTASWCGPCKIAYPKFVALSERLSDVTFLRCVGDMSTETKSLLKREGVRSVPTFHLWKTGEKKQIISGSNVDEVETAVKLLK